MARTAAIRKSKPAAAALIVTLPALAKGEVYAGILLDKDGKPVHQLVLLPGETTANWKDAGAWAKKQGGELPTRKEQALLFANVADQFERVWYWSCEQYAAYADYAWIQLFYGGYQGFNPTSYHCRARAVRRVPI